MTANTTNAETEQAVGRGVSMAVRDPVYYRVWLEQRIHDCVEQHGVVALMDWFNQCEEVILSKRAHNLPPVINVDVTLATIQDWFDTTYHVHPTPHTSLNRRRTRG